MSLGTPITCLRIPAELDAKIMAALDGANVNRVEEPYNKTTWILAAIREKLSHLERSRRKKHDSLPRQPETIQDTPSSEIEDGVPKNILG